MSLHIQGCPYNSTNGICTCISPRFGKVGPIMEPVKPVDLDAIRHSFVENDCIDARVVALCDEVERLRTRVNELEAKAEEDSYAKKDRERFLHKLAEIKMETGRLVGNSRGRRFDEGCKYAGLRIQKIIMETGELEKGDTHEH